MNKNFEWCGYHWKCSMEGDRIIHPSYPWMWYDNTQVMRIPDNGIELHITPDKGKTIKYWDGKIYNPTIACGLIRTEEEFGYGTFSIELQLPKGKNLWPSFWLTGSENWPPEIDIMEAWQDNKGSYFRWTIPQFPYINPSWRTTTNVHYKDTDMKNTNISSKNVSVFKQCKDPSEHFLEYKVVWLPNSITFYIDDTKVREVTGKVCEYLVSNLNHPDKSWKMNVVLNVFCENPDEYDIDMKVPMLIKDFKYEAL